LARLHGWRVYTIPDSRRASMAGYPDLTMWNVAQDRIVFAELKREKGKLSEAQQFVLKELLQITSVETYVWRPSDWEFVVGVLSEKITQNKSKKTRKK
jgi:VRR-NUC domain